MIDELLLLEVPKFVAPCPSAAAILAGHGSQRLMSLSKFKDQPGHCAWCAASFESKGLKPHHMRRWCSDDCIASAQFKCHPQSPGPKMYRLIFDQGFACRICGESFEDTIREMIVHKYEHWNTRTFWDDAANTYRARTTADPVQKVTMHILGYGTGDLWQTDHIWPVHKGGRGIDSANLQVVCVECHLKKTASERRSTRLR